MIEIESAQRLKSLLQEPKKIVITTHHKPDGDAMGSSLGWKIFLQNMGHSVEVISPTDWAKFLDFLPDTNTVIQFEQEVDRCRDLTLNADIIFCLDFNHLSRINNLGPIVRKSNALKVLIDHHQSPEEVFDIVFSYTHACSTAEIVYELIAAMQEIEHINDASAQCIYTGIVSDTARFLHDNTTPEVMMTAANLMKYNVDSSKINENLFGNYTEKRLRFIAHCILNRLEILPEYKSAIMYVNCQDLTNFGIQTGDTEHLVNYPMMLEDVNFVSLVIDRTVMRKISFRSKGTFRCNELAAAHFNGGGHINASGGSSTEGLYDTINRIKSLLPTYQNQILQSHKN